MNFDMLTSSPLKLVIKIPHDSNCTTAGSVLESIKEGKQFINKEILLILFSYSSADI